MADMESSKTTTINAGCHCKTHRYAIAVPNEALPLPTSHCHCNMCRQTNGAVFESYTALPSSVPPPYAAESLLPPDLKYYSCTPTMRRYFCSKCGTHLFYHDLDPGSWGFNTGCLDTLEPNLVKFTYHIYVAEGPKEDGFCRFNQLDDGLPRYAEGETKTPLTPEEVTSLLELAKPTESVPVDPSQRLLASCYCGRVRALLSRPSAHPENKWLKQFATADQTKWIGSNCGCDSCRVSSGAIVSNFVFPPAPHIEWLPSAEPGSGPKDEPGAGGPDDWRGKAGMNWWRSTETVVRGFCGTCGASAMYQCNERPGLEPMGDMGFTKWGQGLDVVSDLFVGLMRTSNKEGERLSDWVVFKGGVSSAGDLEAFSGQLKEGLVSGTNKLKGI